MLQQFFKDWNNALQTRRIIRPNKPVTDYNVEESIVMFRNTEIVFTMKAKAGDENLPFEQRRWVRSLYVPSTNKFIPPTAPSMVKLAIYILQALKPGREHEDHVAAREAAAIGRINASHEEERIRMLSDTTYTTAEVAFICNWINTHSNAKHMSWNDTLTHILVKYNNYITGRGLIELGINLYDDAKYHTRRCYDTVAMCLDKVMKDHYGNETLPLWAASSYFLYPKDVQIGVYTVRSVFSKIYDECGTTQTSKFVHVLRFLADYYGSMFGIPLDKRIEEMRIRSEKRRDRMTHREITGSRSAVQTVAAIEHPERKPVGGVAGELRDAVMGTPSSEPAKREPKPHVRNAVTDGVIRDKAANLRREAEKIMQEQEAAKVERAIPVCEPDPAIETELETITPDSIGTIGDMFPQLGM